MADAANDLGEVKGPRPRLPNTTNRTVVAGSTGSGKTVFGVGLLSTRKPMDWEKMPVIMFNWKSDRLIDSLGAEPISVHRSPPHRPGLYVAHPMPDEDNAATDKFLYRVWEQENTGLFFDEAAELEKSKTINRVMKQGRSRNIPCISCTQRPCWLPRSVFSEAEFFAILRLNDRDDQTTLKRFVNADVYKRRGKYCALWYDGEDDIAHEFAPVPPPSHLRAAFKPRPKRGFLRRVV